MNDISSAFAAAAHLILAADKMLYGIVLLSLEVSLTAVAAATAIGLPLGAAVAVTPFPGRPALIVPLNALMGLPPVVVGLLVYLMSPGRAARSFRASSSRLPPWSWRRRY